KINEMMLGDETLMQIYTGTEHIVKKITDSVLRNDDLIKKQGRELRNDTSFSPEGTNVNFIHPLSKNTLFLRTYERGVEDLTLDCGTGAIASALAWHHMKNEPASGLFSTIVQTDGGTLQVEFSYNKKDKTYKKITLTGEARYIFKGRYKI